MNLSCCSCVIPGQTSLTFIKILSFPKLKSTSVSYVELIIDRWASTSVIISVSTVLTTKFLKPLRGQPNGHIFVDSPSILRRNSTWKVRENYIDFERRIHVEIMTSIRRGYFDVDSTFKIDEISMSSPRGFFYVISTSNRRNSCTRCFHFLTFSALGIYSKLFWYNAQSLQFQQF